jgi:hypothetical protein
MLDCYRRRAVPPAVRAGLPAILPGPKSQAQTGVAGNPGSCCDRRVPFPGVRHTVRSSACLASPAETRTVCCASSDDEGRQGDGNGPGAGHDHSPESVPHRRAHFERYGLNRRCTLRCARQQTAAIFWSLPDISDEALRGFGAAGRGPLRPSHRSAIGRQSGPQGSLCVPAHADVDSALTSITVATQRT